MCQAGREGLWFPLLDALIDSQRAMQNKLTQTWQEYIVLMRDLTKHVVNSMMNLVVSASHSIASPFFLEWRQTS